MNYKLLVLDLDGTLTNSKKEITPFTRETLLQAQEKGLHLVLASGRPTYGIVPLAEELNIKQYGGFILSFNGGKVIDLMTDKVLFEQALPPDIVPVLYNRSKEAGLAILSYNRLISDLFLFQNREYVTKLLIHKVDFCKILSKLLTCLWNIYIHRCQS